MASALCALPLIAAFLPSCGPPPPLATGYVEGEFLLIAPVAAARVETLAVRRGDAVAAGAPLAIMERRDAEIALAEATAALARAESELADLREGRRSEEIRVLEAELASARALQVEAARSVGRLRDLRESGAVSQAQLDEAATQLDIARARVAEAQASLAVAALPARPQQIAAAEAAAAQAAAARDAAVWQLDERTVLAPAAGAVHEVLRRPGEIAGPQAPILSLLPEGGVLLRLYVPEPRIAEVAPGTELAVNCEGCPPGTSATVQFVADEPEFTPPVIYSLENRQKLVYLVEARPDPGAAVLKPGQIVDVRLAGPGR
jgi:HlyD family secretion protein